MTNYKEKYPVGEFQKPSEITSEHLSEWISEIELFPQGLKQATEALNDQQMDTPYREGGWTIRQLVHHCADSHSNALIRFKLALTEESPVIKPYFEASWAELADSREMPVEISIKILEGLHARWVYLLKKLTEENWRKFYIHPEFEGKKFLLGEAAGLYAWHGRHHLTHIKNLKIRNGWE